MPAAAGIGGQRARRKGMPEVVQPRAGGARFAAQARLPGKFDKGSVSKSYA